MTRERPRWHLLLTCEHAGNRVPPAWAALFRGQRRLLASHRGFDAGALPLARALARATRAPLLFTATTRLLVDANRSPHNPRVFSEITRRLPRAERERLLARWHAPHWQRVRSRVRRNRDAGAATLHVAVHSFTPVHRGVRRAFDVGLLYDPSRAPERRLALRWQRALAGADAGLRVRRNAPYRGAADGLTTALRREHAARDYLGIELEASQSLLSSAARRRRLAGAVAALLLAAVGPRRPQARAPGVTPGEGPAAP